MGTLSYAMQVSADGYVNDAAGSIDWTEPDMEVHVFFERMMEPVSTFLYGRRMYEMMVYWEDFSAEDAEGNPYLTDFAEVWRAKEKIVFSSTLTEVRSERTRIVPAFSAEAVAELKATSPGDLTIDGPTLAAEALRAGLVDEVGMMIVPRVLGGGTPFWPSGLDCGLERVETVAFASGMTWVKWRIHHHGE